MNGRAINILITGCALALFLTGCGKEGGDDGEQPVEALTQTTELADYSAYVTLGQYTDLNIPVAVAAIAEEALQNSKNQLIESYNYFYAETEQITDREVILNDMINMDFTVTVDGEDIDWLSGEDVSYAVGAEQIDPELDQQMVGLEPGDTYDLVCTFAEDTDFTELAGRTVIFHVTVNYIYGEVQSAVWGDELVTIVTNGQYTSADAYEDYLYQSLLETAEAEQLQMYTDELWNTVLANCTFDELPADIIEENGENYYTSRKSLYEYYASYYSYSYEYYMETIQGMTDQEFHEQSYEYARIELERIYTAVTIYHDLGLEFTDEEFSRGVAALAEQYGYDSSAEFVESYGEEYIREVLVTQAVEEYLLEHNNMVVLAD